MTNMLEKQWNALHYAVQKPSNEVSPIQDEGQEMMSFNADGQGGIEAF